MRVAVLMKQVPDSWSEKNLDPKNDRLDRNAAERVINEPDEYAIELAVQWQEVLGVDTIAITMGPVQTTVALRRACAMGISQGLLLWDKDLEGADAHLTAKALAAAVDLLEVDIVLTGIQSTDAKMGVIPAMVAERLGWPALLRARSAHLEYGAVRVERQTEFEYVQMASRLPAVISVVEGFNKPRFPGFKGILANKTREFESKHLRDIGIPWREVFSHVDRVTKLPIRVPSERILDTDGDSAIKILEVIKDRGFLA
jgi:electron transfer flavoprotein beta subunit